MTTAAATVAEIQTWPAVVPLWPNGGRAFGLGRSQTFALAARGEFPTRVLRLGRKLRVCTADLLAAVGAPPA